MADEAYRAVFLRVHPTGKMVLSLTTEADGREPEYAAQVGREPLDPLQCGVGEAHHPRRAVAAVPAEVAQLLDQPLLDQAAPEAVIVVPLGYGIVRVTVTGPGHASGRFLPTPAYFMARRSNGAAPRFDETARQQPTDTTVPPADLLERLKKEEEKRG